MAMAKITIKLEEGKERVLQTDDFNEEQNGIFAEAGAAERELNRYKYLVAIFNDRRDFLLGKLLESVDKEDDGTKET